MSPARAEAKVESAGVPNLRRSSPNTMERRRRVRLPVQWPVYIWAPNTGAPVETTTTNLSSDGFHCLSPIPLEPGEIIGCTLTMPQISNQGSGRRRVLECQIRIVRLEPPNKDGNFGLACYIENFRIAAD
jgi:PilZ domain